MNAKLLRTFAVSSAVLVGAVLSGKSQSPFFQAVTNLNPAGYWPMHEMEAGAPGDIETNYGSLGPLGNGYYADWAAAPGGIQHGQTGALANDSDTAAAFASEPSGSYTNCLSIPHTSPSVTLTPPFSVECWWMPNTAGTQGDIWSQMGLEGLNAGATYGGQNGVINGTRLFWNPNFYLYVYHHTATQTQVGNTGATTAGVWHHLVVTCDAQTNFSLYLDGNLKIGPKSEVGFYEPDYWSPITFANGRGYTRNGAGSMDEFAIYTNVIADVSTHYSDGVSGSAGQYFQDVTNDNPVVYLRMDSPAYTAPSTSVWPVLTNYGSAAVNGVYSPGTMPGVADGPANSIGQPFQGLSGRTVAPLSGVSSFADAGYAAAYNPTGAVPFSMMAMFRGNPSDPRLQTIIGHSGNSWRIEMNLLGQLQCTLGTNSASVVASSGVYNDGNWHQVVAVYTPASNPNATGTNTLYVDGIPDASVTTVSTNGIGAGSPLDVMIGADPQFTNNPAGLGRQFAGRVCEAALFTNALTAGQIQALYNAAEASPDIKTQPVSGTVGQGGAYTNVMVATGSAPLSYQWYNTNGVTLADQTNANLVFNPVLSGNSGSYYVIVTNSYGSATSSVISLTVSPKATITSQFPITYASPFNLYAGSSPTFTLSAIGANPIAYYWFTNGVLDGAATGSSLTLTNILAGSANCYCIVSNSFGSVTSMVWSASVIAIPDDGHSGTATYPQAVLALKPLGYWRLNDPEAGGGDAGVLCQDYADGNNGIYTNVTLGNSGYNPNWDPSDTSVQAGTLKTANSFAGQIGTNIDFGEPGGSNAEFSVEVWMQPSANPPFVTYANNFPGGGIVAKGYYGTEEFALDNNSPGVTNGFRFFVRDAAGNAHAANSSISTVVGQWYHLVGVCDEANGNVLLYVNGTLAASAAIPPFSGILDSSSVNMTIGSKGVSSVIGYPLQTRADLNDVAVFNYALSTSQITGEYLQAAIAPFFTVVPTNNVNIASGSNLVVSAAAVGSLPLFYQWFDTNDVPIPDQTNATLSISGVTAGNGYYLSVSNAFGMTNSSVVTVGVFTGPMFVSQSPVSYTNVLTLFAGASPTFSVHAVSLQNNQPVYYQWFTNGAAQSGATSSSLTFANIQNPFTNFYCVASNLLASSTSFVWNVSVIAAPTNPYPRAALSLHPAGYWRLDEPDDGFGDGNPGAIAHDYVSGNNGVYTNTDLGQNGYNTNTDPASAVFGFNSLFDCDAYGINVDFGASAGTTVGFSVEAWVDGYTQSKDAGIVSKGYSGAEQFCLDTGSDGGTPSHAFRFFVRDASGTVHAANSTNYPDPGAQVWHHLVGVCDESNGKVTLYVDGAATASTSIGTTAGVLSSSRSMLIGSRPSGIATENDDQFVGYIDDVAVFNHALTANQVTNEFQGIIAPSLNLNPTNIAYSLSAGQLTLSWPGDHTGWRLQAQTNGPSKGLGTNWFDVANSQNTNQVVISINPTNGSVFYRMVYP